VAIVYLTSTTIAEVVNVANTRTGRLDPHSLNMLNNSVVNAANNYIGNGYNIEWAIETIPQLGDRPLLVVANPGTPVAAGGTALKDLIAKTIQKRALPNLADYHLTFLWLNGDWTMKLASGERAVFDWKMGAF
jgi:hypothetical protein